MGSTMIISIVGMLCAMLNFHGINGYRLDDHEDLMEVPHSLYVNRLPFNSLQFPLGGNKKHLDIPLYYNDIDANKIRRHRFIRSLQPGAPNFPIPGQNNNEGWRVQPSLSKGQDGNTRGSVNVQHSGPNHEVNAQVDKVIRGPGKSKPTYSIHGSWNF
ncbi:hypothetical protein HHI36_020530 [Cryptolaemus montrouzieri]|uniref:Uncharacterized protein n=1 Tax=Cryptolaemus montrouzieri TaxID=559131 RepID=A0ABD2NB93_9CUCU